MGCCHHSILLSWDVVINLYAVGCCYYAMFLCFQSSYRCALMSSGCVLQAVDAVLLGKVRCYSLLCIDYLIAFRLT